MEGSLGGLWEVVVLIMMMMMVCTTTVVLIEGHAEQTERCAEVGEEGEEE